ncbi:MAG: Amt family ammonium transporter [Oleiphilaceae bacterium]|jgi:Amt family ammonium transporter
MQENLWILISALLVFCMQAGFLCLESGSTRSKNNINVAAKNVLDFLVSSALFWLVGFGLMFGQGTLGFVGTSHFFFGEGSNANELSFFIFQMMFCSTAATLTSGAVAERMTFLGYIYVTIILSVVIYPIIGHWVWGGAFLPDNQGWLEALGFVDFAGATVVHSVGGWFALAAVLVVGPRLGRFTNEQVFPTGSNLPMAALGVFLIWLGWFGFNGGSTLVLNDQVPLILLNTCLSAIWGGLAVTFLHYRHRKFVDIGYSLNGIIAGLVGITASCHAVSPKESALIGVVSGGVLYLGTLWLQRLKIDDALSVVPAHLMAGIWGTLAVALFGDPIVLGTGLDFSEQLQAQMMGIISIGLYSFGLSYILISLINKFYKIRVSVVDEMLGLNVSEHHAKTELIELLSEMETQQCQGDFTSSVKEEPFTEVGQIAEKYNQVIAKVATEITQRDNAIDQFKMSEKRKSAILDSSMDCIVSIDRNGKVIEFNRTAEKILGSLKKRIVGNDFIQYFVCKEDRLTITKSLFHGFSTGEGLILNRRTTLQLQRLSGDFFPAEVTITNTHLGAKHCTEYTLHIRDIAQEMKLQSRLQYLAYKDPLTGLSNRTHMMKALRIFVETAQTQNLSVALFFLDLDKFKKINDTLGHEAGDELLREVASRLKSISREADVIARWGGDEFVYIILGKLDRHVILQKAEHILEQLRRPVLISKKEYKIPTSIGVSISKNGVINADNLIQFADIAMYHAKEKGRDNCQFYTATMGESAAKALTLEHEIKKALAKRQFFLVYQPKVKKDVNTNTIVGVEALIRWCHPSNGEVHPSEFIPMAEESYLIVEVGEFVLTEALLQIRRWLDAGIEPVPISVNISGHHLMTEEFFPFIAQLLNRYGINGSLLEIEITEHVLIQDIERCIIVLNKIKSLGLSISIDDFGTGYSSLSYLKRLPLDILKIDRLFVSECNTINEDKTICSAIINLAAGMNLKTIAEGVETQEQVTTLQALGCDNFQGYYFYKPLLADDLTCLLGQVVPENKSSQQGVAKNLPDCPVTN